MRNWALRMESQRRLEEQPVAASPHQLIHPYVAISREAGVDGGEIANLVAAKRDWKVLDRELLDYMAENYHWSRIALEYVDERTASWFHETFGKWLDQQLVSQAEYVSRLGRVILMAAQHESTVFVGRGAQFILPRDVGLSVRIINVKQRRIKRIVERLECSPGAAEEFVDETDKGRADFVRRYFHHEVADPHLYDLVINLEHTSRDAAADLILSDYKLRFGPS
jgi:cytidylate kinase